MNNKNAQVQVNVDLNKIPWMKCICGSEKFVTVNKLKHIPALLTGANKDITWGAPIHKCMNPKCGMEYDEAKSEHFLRQLKKEIKKQKAEKGSQPAQMGGTNAMDDDRIRDKADG